jgi:hypothetical protein
MADTTKIKTVIEPHVRLWLSKKFPGHVFEEKSVQLVTGETYKFDAVAEDGSIVGAILSSRSLTRTRRENTGGVRKALAEISHLKLTPSSARRIMVFTDHGFCQLVQRRAKRLGVESIETMVCVLPSHLDSLLREILDRASHEQRAAE